jgi:uncharacterized Fe-S cluster protein YjdI
VKEYINGEIAVFWKPEKCIHSAECLKGLLGVFDLQKSSWVDIEGAASEEIGVVRDGPLLVSGRCALAGQHGREYIKLLL